MSAESTARGGAVYGDGERSLAGIAIFEGLDATELGRLEARCRWKRFGNGERILEYGSASREVFFIIRGSANVLNVGLTGREVAFAKMTTGNCFGELSAIDGRPRSASVVAGEDTLLAVLPSEVFLELLQRRAEVTFRLLRQLTNMIRRGDIRIMELSTLAASYRVYAELLRMAKPDAAVAGRWVIHPVPPLREVAAHVSTTRETVARAVGQLYREGIVRRKGRALYLLDRERLAEIVSSLRLEGP